MSYGCGCGYLRCAAILPVVHGDRLAGWPRYGTLRLVTTLALA